MFAEQLAEDYGVEFSKVFANQYFFAKTKTHHVKDLKRRSYGEWVLFHGSGLPVADLTVHDGRTHFVFLGVGIDENGAYISLGQLRKMWNASRSTSAMIEMLNKCAGRFVFAVFCAGFDRIYGDACGSLATYYEPKAETVGCSQFLVLDRPLDPNTDYPDYENAAKVPGSFFAFTETADKHTKQLLANHYLDLRQWQQNRFWPTEDMDFTIPTTVSAIEELTEQIIARHQQIIGAVSAMRQNCALPISGGSDSRTILAMSKPHLENIDCFVHIMGWTTRNDAYIARELAEKMGFDLRIFDAVKHDNVRLSLLDKYRTELELNLAQGLLDPHAPRRDGLADTTNAVPKGSTVLRGQVINICKGYYITPGVVREYLAGFGALNHAGVGIKALKLHWYDGKGRRFYKKRYAEWLETLPESAKLRAVDLALIEQHRSHSMARFFNIFTKSFYMIPSCDRSLIHNMVRIPPNIRFDRHIQDLIIRIAAPEIQRVRYNSVLSERSVASGESLADALRQLPAVA